MDQLWCLENEGLFAVPLTCMGKLFAMVKLGIGGRALYVLVRAVSDLPSMDPDVKDTVVRNKQQENIKIITFYRTMRY